MTTSSHQPATGYGSRLQLAGGVYTQIQDLIRLRYASKEISLAPSRARNPLSGLLTSRSRGRGIDFAEVRLYQPGDDIRTIDWRVTARTGKAHTKLFEEEREKPVMILADQSQHMFFGSRRAFKSVAAAQAAALFAWIALERGDRVGGIVFSDSEHREIRPRRNKHSVLKLLHELDEFNHRLQRQAAPPQRSYLTDALRNVRHVARHGSAILIISDFAALDESAISHLNKLAQHNDVTGIQITDPLDKNLPRPDLYTITDGESRSRINTLSRKNRDAYALNWSEHQKSVERSFLKLGAPLFELSTADLPIEALANKYSDYNYSVQRSLNRQRGRR